MLALFQPLEDPIQPFENQALLAENQFELVELLGFLAMMQVLVERLFGFQMLVALGFALDQSQHF